MPPVSTPSNASAGPGSAIAVSAVCRRPSTAAADGARRGPLRPGPAMAFRQAALASPALPAPPLPNSRASAPDAASARPRRIAASARAIASEASEPYSTPSKASRPARSAIPTARRGAAGAASVRVVTAVSIASTKAGASKPASASWNEARFSTKPGTVPSRPCQIGADGDPWRSSSMRCRRSDSGISSPARNALSAIGRIQASAAVASMTGCSPGTSAAKRGRCCVIPSGRQRHQSWRGVRICAHHHATHSNALPCPGCLHARMLSGPPRLGKRILRPLRQWTTKSCGLTC